MRVQGRHLISACAVSAEVVPLLYQQRADTGLLQLIKQSVQILFIRCIRMIQVIRTTDNGAPACKICGAAYKTRWEESVSAGGASSILASYLTLFLLWLYG